MFELLLLVALFAVYIATEVVFYYNEEKWEQRAIEYIPKFQEGVSDKGLEIAIIYSDVMYLFLAPAILIWMWPGQRARSCYYILCYNVCAFVGDLSKLVKQAPRPFWLSTEVRTQSCST